MEIPLWKSGTNALQEPEEHRVPLVMIHYGADGFPAASMGLFHKGEWFDFGEWEESGGRGVEAIDQPAWWAYPPPREEG